jgi:hypothetical protein
MDKFSKIESGQHVSGFTPFHEEEKPGKIQGLLMLAATLVLPFAGSFALMERPTPRVASVERSTPSLVEQAAMPGLAMLDEKN